MRDEETALAIELEERFHGTICYFGRAPSARAKVPNQLIILHSSGYGQMSIEVFCRPEHRPAEELVTEVYQFLADLTLQIDDRGKFTPTMHLSFTNGNEIPPISKLDGFEGFAFATELNGLRKAAA